MCHVLIIEDDWIIADHIAQLVETAGAMSIDMAITEDEAVTHALTRPPAVIVSDVSLAAGTGPAGVLLLDGRLRPSQQPGLESLVPALDVVASGQVGAFVSTPALSQITRLVNASTPRH